MKYDNTYWMKLALKMSRQGLKDGELPFGVVLVVGDKIVSKGRCRERKRHTVLAHAEAEAVDKACRKLGTTKLLDATIYCTNEPCIMCAAAIFQAKIPRVVIGASRDDIGILRPRDLGIDELAKDSGFPIVIIRDVLKEEVVTLFRDSSHA